MKTFKTYLEEAAEDVENTLSSLKKLKYDAAVKKGNNITVKTSDDRVEVLQKIAKQLKGEYQDASQKGVTSSAGRTVLPNGVKIEAKDSGENKLRNKGDIAEGLLGLALYTKFQNRVGEEIKDISAADFTASLNNLRKKKSQAVKKGAVLYQKVNIKDLRKNQDTVNLTIMLPQPSYEDLLDKSKDKLIMKLARSAINYANSRNVTRYAKFLYVNNSKNVIDVKSEGTLDQSGTKVDLKVVVDGRLLKNLNISLKSGTSTKQFGQVFGYTASHHTALWKNLGLNYSTKQKEHDNMILDDDGIVKAFHYSYKWAANEINKRLKNDKQEFAMLKTIAKMINFYATRNEKNVKLVHFKDSGNYSVLSFDKLEDRLKKIKLEAVYRDLTLPTIDIQDSKTKKKLISIKGKRELRAYRNLIQKEKLLEELLEV